MRGFINRLQELEIFKRALSQGRSTRLLIISGPSGIGKSALLYKFTELSQDNNVLSTVINLRQSGDGFSSVIGRICDSIGWENFPGFYDRLTKLSSLPAISVRDVSALFSKVEVALGGFSRQERQTLQLRITLEFFEHLRNISQTQQLVILFDSFETADSETQKWLTESFLVKAERLSGLLVVIAGREIPNTADLSMSPFVESIHLGPITDLSAWMDYARLLGAPASEEVIQLLQLVTEGNPMMMAMTLQTLKTTG